LRRKKTASKKRRRKNQVQVVGKENPPVKRKVDRKGRKRNAIGVHFLRWEGGREPALPKNRKKEEFDVLERKGCNPPEQTRRREKKKEPERLRRKKKKTPDEIRGDCEARSSGGAVGSQQTEVENLDHSVSGWEEKHIASRNKGAPGGGKKNPSYCRKKKGEGERIYPGGHVEFKSRRGMPCFEVIRGKKGGKKSRI